MNGWKKKLAAGLIIGLTASLCVQPARAEEPGAGNDIGAENEAEPEGNGEIMVQSVGSSLTVTEDTILTENADYTGEGGPAVSIAPGVTLTIQATVTAVGRCNGSGVELAPGSRLIVASGGNLTASGGRDNGAGITGKGAASAADTFTVEIQEGGSLTAVGGTNGAGIGGDNSVQQGTYQITMTGGSLTALGGTNGAGIGGGNKGGGSYAVNISGGQLELSGGRNGAGIGAGDKKDIQLSASVTGGTFSYDVFTEVAPVGSVSVDSVPEGNVTWPFHTCVETSSASCSWQVQQLYQIRRVYLPYAGTDAVEFSREFGYGPAGGQAAVSTELPESLTEGIAGTLEFQKASAGLPFTISQLLTGDASEPSKNTITLTYRQIPDSITRNDLKIRFEPAENGLMRGIVTLLDPAKELNPSGLQIELLGGEPAGSYLTIPSESVTLDENMRGFSFLFDAGLAGWEQVSDTLPLIKIEGLEEAADPGIEVTGYTRKDEAISPMEIIGRELTLQMTDNAALKSVRVETEDGEILLEQSFTGSAPQSSFSCTLTGEDQQTYWVTVTDAAGGTAELYFRFIQEADAAGTKAVTRGVRYAFAGSFRIKGDPTCYLAGDYYSAADQILEFE